MKRTNHSSRGALVCSVLLIGLTAPGASLRAQQYTPTNPPYTISELAGPPPPGANGYLDGVGNAARFNLALSIATDSSGNIYVADSNNNVIREVTAAGVVSTFAGAAGISGSLDGLASSARFNGPRGVAVDGSGNVYVADTGNNTIRKITPSGFVTTPAGLAGSAGDVDGTGGRARFNIPIAVAADSAGNVYVTGGSSTIRKMTPAGVVTTLAGTAGKDGYVDGAGTVALFNEPHGIAVDGAGIVYVADGKVRKITPSGFVTTLVGSPQVFEPTAIAVDSSGYVYVTEEGGDDNIMRISPAGAVTSLALNFSGGPFSGSSPGYPSLPDGIAVDGLGRVYASDAMVNAIYVAVPTPVRPFINASPVSQVVNVGASTSLSVSAGGSGLAYQWQLNGVNIPGATYCTLNLQNVGSSQAGSYTAVITNTLGSVTSSPATLTTNVSSYLYNISSRAPVGFGPYQNIVAGFFTDGSGSKNVVVRGVGPGLASVDGSLPNQLLLYPELTLFNGNAAALATSIAWGGGQTLVNAFANVYAFPLQPNSTDTALFMSVPAGSGIGYTAEVDALNNVEGIALVEVYDYDAFSGMPASHLINISTRAAVGSGNNVLVAGFWIFGSTSQSLLIRAVGPGLASSNPALNGLTLAKPNLTLYDASGNVIASNLGWSNAPVPGNSTVVAGIQPATTAIMSKVGATAIAAGSADCAMVVTLPSNAGYTVQVDGTNSTTGIALVEVYNVP